MKQLIITLLISGLSLASPGQGRSDAIASAGGSSSDSGITLSWTLGELIVPVYTSGNLTLAHGFQSQLILTSVEENTGMPVLVKVYPNPAGDNIVLQFEEPVDKRVAVTLIDSHGKTVLADVIAGGATEKFIDLGGLAAGIYYLKLTRGPLVNVYKVVKL